MHVHVGVKDTYTVDKLRYSTECFHSHVWVIIPVFNEKRLRIVESKTQFNDLIFTLSFPDSFLFDFLWT